MVETMMIMVKILLFSLARAPGGRRIWGNPGFKLFSELAALLG